MESYYQATQSWLLFGAIAGGLVWYYYPHSSRPQSRPKSIDRTSTAPKRRDEREHRPKPRLQPDQVDTTLRSSGNDLTKRKEKDTQPQSLHTSTPAVIVQNDDVNEIDMSTRQFAQQMAKARQGQSLQAPKGKEKRLRTVKQGSAVDNPALSSASSQAGAEADDDLSPAHSPALPAGDVSDMLESSPAPPTTLRLTGEIKEQKLRPKPKEAVVETKKQRQNRQKIEERRVQREGEEKQRKVLEEQQRRAAREARGEPAKNGIPVSKPPANNAWTAPKPVRPLGSLSTPGPDSAAGPLLDTFDAESTGSSNGVLGGSTAATSTTTDGAAAQWEQEASEEEQMARAMKESEDESGWTTVAMPKKQKKKGGNDDGDNTPIAEPVVAPKAKPQPVKPSGSSQSNGFQALQDQHVQRTNVDPDDADNWDA